MVAKHPVFFKNGIRLRNIYRGFLLLNGGDTPSI
jgi:hypothetical protein